MPFEEAVDYLVATRGSPPREHVYGWLLDDKKHGFSWDDWH
jgi:hypothetical protein